MKAEEVELQELLSQAVSKHNRAGKRSVIYTVISLCLGLLWLSYSFYKVSELAAQEQTLRQKSEELNRNIRQGEEKLIALKQEIDEKQKFLGVISTSIGMPVEAASPDAFEERRKTTIEYFLKDVDQEKVLSAIQDLGFQVKQVSPVGNTATNCIWFGSRTDIEDVKLVAYALIHAGVKVKDIRPFANSEGREDVIQIGGRPLAVGNPSYTVEQIKAVKQFTR